MTGIPTLAMLASVLVTVVGPAPAAAGLAPRSNAAVDVAVATLWARPGEARAIDAPSLGNPVDLPAWNRKLSTTASRIWLDGHVVTQALYGEKVRVLALHDGWAKVAVVDQPTPLDRRGYPGWLPVRQLRPAFDSSGPHVVVRTRTAKLRVNGRTIALSYGTRLPLVRRAGKLTIVRTPDGQGALAGAGSPARATGKSIVTAARRFVGVRYLWGGVSAWGFDCSGLVWDLFHATGVTVPRDADPSSGTARASPSRTSFPETCSSTAAGHTFITWRSTLASDA